VLYRNTALRGRPSSSVDSLSPALARLRKVKGRSGSNPRRATLASAERQGAVAGTGNYNVVAGPGGGTERGLTPRSRRGPTASHQARATGTQYIIRGPGLAACRRSRLNSNVRPHNPPFCT